MSKSKDKEYLVEDLPLGQDMLDYDMGYPTCIRYPETPNNPKLEELVVDMQDLLEFSIEKLQAKLARDQPTDDFLLWCSLTEWRHELADDVFLFVDKASMKNE